MNIIAGIRLALSTVFAMSMLHTSALGEEHWPGSYIYWPSNIIGHLNPCSTCSYLMSYFTFSDRPIEAHHNFMTDIYGAYFFKTCDQLANFVNGGVLGSEVTPLPARHVLISLRMIPYTAGVAHDDVLGDGYVFMAPVSHPVETYSDKGYARHRARNTFLRHHSPRHRIYEMTQKAPLRAAEPIPAFKDAPSHIACGAM